MAKRKEEVQEPVKAPKPCQVVKFTQRHETNTHNFAEGLVYDCGCVEQAEEYVNQGVAVYHG